MKKKSANQPKHIANRRARHDYELGDSLVAGISLTGAETKALRMGHGHLRGAYANIKDGEMWLINATIVGTRGVNIPENERTRTRKLLLKRREIETLGQAKQQGRTIVPLEILTGGRYIKVRLAIGKGRKLYDKRQNLKARDESRAMSAAIKRSLR
ncbi:MAG TPA: SsrA-binding protein SmpB [Candidatus Saccharimonadales bacterium]|nr:SsrA-binding protein SmpB [Candidatus Saccharimonadales bacterium]